MLRSVWILALVCFAVPAAAEPTLTVSLEPVMLVMPMVDSTIEYSPVPHLGLAVRAGYGHIGIPFVAGANIYELGGQANWYINQSFKGWHVGTEATWLWGGLSGYLFDNQQQMMPSQQQASPERVLGAYGGYKFVWWRGMSAVVQVGVGKLDMKSSPDGPIHQVIPVANANLGWSF
jgi:hypothetical protein